MRTSSNKSDKASQSTSPPDAVKLRYTCPDCHKHYQAKETLQRHRKNHACQVENICEICQSGFVRRDLLLRHYRIHQGADPGGSLSKDRQRSRRACDRCSKLKIKCSSLLPTCFNCQQRNTTCNYNGVPANRARNPRSNSTDANGPRQTNPRPSSPRLTSNMDDSSNPDVTVQLEPPMVPFANDFDFSLAQGQSVHSTPNDDSLLETTSTNAISAPNMTWPWLHEDLFLQDDPLGNVDYSDLSPMDISFYEEQEAPVPRAATTGWTTSAAQFLESSRSEVQYDVANSLPRGGRPALVSHMQIDIDFPEGCTTSTLLEPNDSSARKDLRVMPENPSPRACFTKSRSHGRLNTAKDDIERCTSHRAQYQERVVQKLVDFACNVSGPPPDPPTRRKFRQEICHEVEQAFGLKRIRSAHTDQYDLLDHFAELYLENFYPLWPLFRRQDLVFDRAPLLLYITLTSIGSIYAGDAAAVYGFMTHEAIRKKIILAPFQSQLSNEVCIPLCQSLLLIQASALYFGRRQSFSIAQQLGSTIVSHARKMNLFNDGLFSDQYSGSEPKAAAPEKDIVSQWIREETRKRLAFGILRAEIFVGQLLDSRPLVSHEEFNITLPCPSIVWEYNLTDLKRHVMTLHQSSETRREYLYSDLVRIAVDRNEALPDLLPGDFELLLFGIQHAVWQFSHDRDMMPRLNRNFKSDFLTNPQNDLFSTWSYSVQNCDKPKKQQLWISEGDNRQFNNTDLLDCYFRDMGDMQIDYLRCLSALRKWKRSFAATCMRTDIKDVRNSLLASRLLYHLSFIRICADVQKFHLLNHQLLKGPVDPKSISPIYDWASSQDAKVALEHACAIWSLISREIRREEHVRAKFNILTHISLYHAACIVWVFAGTHASPTEAALDMVETSGNSSINELLIHSANIPRITLEFAALLNTVTPAWMQSSSFSTTTSMMATRPFPKPPVVPIT